MRHVDPVGGAQRLGQDVADARHLEDVAGGTAGDDAGTGCGRLEQDSAGPALPDDRVHDGAAGQGHLEEVLARLFDPLLHGQPGLLGLAVAQADLAVAIADHHEGGEGEAAATLDHLGHPVHLDGALFVLCVDHLELQSLGPRRVSHGGDPPVVHEAPAVEDHLGDASRLGP